MTLKRGFKTYAKKLAREVREELGLSQISPLDHFALAAHLSIPVFPMSQYSKQCPNLDYFIGKGQKYFSAITLFSNTWRMIIHNDFHALCRQKSNIVHEIAHALLQHPPVPHLNDSGERNYNSGIEGEADWLTGVLLIPEEAALQIVGNNVDKQLASDRYGVCPKMLTYRLQVTAAHKRVALFKAK